MRGELCHTVYPKKYAHGFCFAVVCCGYTLTDFPISIRLTSLALWQSNDCPSASKATLMNMDKYFMWIHYERLHNHNKAKHNKTVCIFLGIYFILYSVHQVTHFLISMGYCRLCSIGYPPETHLKPKSREISFASKSSPSYRIILQICTKHRNCIAVSCAKFQIDRITDTNVTDEGDFTRSKFKMSFGLIFYIAQMMTVRWHSYFKYPTIQSQCLYIIIIQILKENEYYRKISNIRRTKFQNLNDSHLVLKSSLPNPLKPGVQSRMKM